MLCMCSKSFDLFASISTPFSNETEAVIFDCDGVLVDTEYLKFLGWQKALASLNIELSIEEYKVVAGHSSIKIIELLQVMKGIVIPEEAIYLRREEYRKLQEQGIAPIKEMVEFAHYLSQNKVIWGIKLGLASSASTNEILFNLKQIGLDEIFDLIISGTDDLNGYEDVGGKNKPKPYIYLEASKRLNIAPERCLVFEDSEVGVEAASKAGMVTIAIPNWITSKQNFSKANKIIHSISELPINSFNTFKEIPFKKDEYLERNPSTSAETCLQEFFQKGETIQYIISLSELMAPKICSGGFCRSQALWQF